MSEEAGPAGERAAAALPRELAALRDAAAALPPELLVMPGNGRIAAAAVLLRVVEADLELVLTRRGDHLSSHPGQVAFPGGRVDPGESTVEAALREAMEEVALRPATARPIGRLPGYYIPPSRFWLQPVLLHWERPHPLHPAEAEVAEIFTTRLSALRDPRRWRAVRLANGADSWAWELESGHVLWGATAIGVVAMLELIDPAWSGGVSPRDLGPRRRIQP